MSRRYEGEDRDDYVDRVTDEAIQNEVDDQAEAREIEAKRQAAQSSPEILSLEQASIEGARAGRRGNGPSMNPYQDFTQEHKAWEAARFQALGASLNNPRRAA